VRNFKDAGLTNQGTSRSRQHNITCRNAEISAFWRTQLRRWVVQQLRVTLPEKEKR